MEILLIGLLAWHVVKGIGQQVAEDFGGWTKDKVGSARNRWSAKKAAVRSTKPAGIGPRFKNLVARAGLLCLDLAWSIGRSIKTGAQRGWRTGRARWAELKEQRAEKTRTTREGRGRHRADTNTAESVVHDDHTYCLAPGCGSADCPARRPAWGSHCRRCGESKEPFYSEADADAYARRHQTECTAPPLGEQAEPTDEELVELAEAIRRAGEGGNMTQPGQVDIEASSLTTQRQSWESFQESAAADFEAAQAEATRLQGAATAAANYAEGLAARGMGNESVAPAVAIAEAKQNQADAAGAAAVAAEQSHAASQTGLTEHAIHEGIADAAQGRQLAEASVYNN